MRLTLQKLGLPKGILNPYTLQRILLDIALPFRETRSSSTHQSTGTNPPNQETFTRHWSNSPTGSDSANKNYDLLACRKETPKQ